MISRLTILAPDATPRASDLEVGLLQLDRTHGGRLSANHSSPAVPLERARCARVPLPVPAVILRLQLFPCGRKAWSHESAARIFTLLGHWRKHCRDERKVPEALAEACDIVVPPRLARLS